MNSWPKQFKCKGFVKQSLQGTQKCYFSWLGKDDFERVDLPGRKWYIHILALWLVSALRDWNVLDLWISLFGRSEFVPDMTYCKGAIEKYNYLGKGLMQILQAIYGHGWWYWLTQLFVKLCLGFLFLTQRVWPNCIRHSVMVEGDCPTCSEGFRISPSRFQFFSE